MLTRTGCVTFADPGTPAISRGRGYRSGLTDVLLILQNRPTMNLQCSR